MISARKQKVKIYRDQDEIPYHMTNGDFSTEVNWSLEDYPGGYLEGWNLPSSVDWDMWKYNTDSGNFELYNKSADKAGTFSFSQSIRLSAGAYWLNAASPYTWDGGNPTGVTLAVESGGQTLAKLQRNPGYGDFGGTEFTLGEDAKVTVTIRFTLPPGATAAIDDITVNPAESTPPAPPFTNPVINGDFPQDITWGPTALPGWMIPADNWPVWSPGIVDGKLRIKNVKEDESTSPESYEISQTVTLGPGTYKIKGDIPQ